MAFDDEEEIEFHHPYSPYPIQQDFMSALYGILKHKKIGLFESPTGTGKSLSLICGSLAYLRNSTNENNEKISENEVANEPEWIKIHRRKLTGTAKALSPIKHRRQKKQKVDVEYETDADPFLLPDTSPVQTSAAEVVPDSNFHSRLANLKRQCGYDSSSSESSAAESDEEDDTRKIIYASRTHSQLAQFVHEIRKTIYGTDSKKRVKCVTLGSRKQLCINPDVAKLSSVERMNDACLDLQQTSKGCLYLKKTNLGVFKEKIFDEVRDIEDLVKLGQALHTCPYYGTRKAVRSAELVALPYPTLLSASTRASLNLSVKNNIVIVDEAHNLIDALTQLHSIHLSQMDIQRARQQLQVYFETYKKRLSSKNCVYVKQILFVLNMMDGYFSKISQKRKDGGPAHEQVMTVPDFVHQTKIETLNVCTLNEYIQSSGIVKKLLGFLEKRQEETNRSKEKENDNKKANTDNKTDDFVAKHSSPLSTIAAFLIALLTKQSDARILIEVVPGNIRESYIKFLLLNPSDVFGPIIEDADSIVLAGGTMAPLSDFRTYLFAKVPLSRLETFTCAHIVPKENLQTIIMDYGPPSGQLNQERLEFTYDRRQRTQMVDDVGKILCNVVGIVPGGVVIFLPSFQYLNTVVAQFRANGTWQRLQARKKLFCESATQTVDLLLDQYQEAILNPENGQTGAVLFAVVGGKVSEGINFGDDLGRCVVMIGLPYPNLKSPEMIEKMAFVDRQRQLIKSQGQEGASDDVPESTRRALSHIPTGNEYYETLCMRAVNQSIGRAIRHRNDYASVLLLDTRYAQVRVRSKLPAWMQSSIVDMTGSGKYGRCLQSLGGFFRQRK